MRFLSSRALRCVALGSISFASACAPPIGVRALSPQDANQALTVNVLSTGRPSVYSARVLQRLGWVSRYDEDAPSVLRQLHEGLGGYDEFDRLLALAELSFAHALESEEKPYFVAAAVYAWSFLTSEGDGWSASPFDERIRLAADLYNRGIALGLKDADGEHVDVGARTIDTFFGPVELSADPNDSLRAGYRLTNFVSLADLDVRGLRNRYRERGIGAPLSARVKTESGLRASRWIGPLARLPVTMVVRFEQAREGLAAGRITGRIELVDPHESRTIDLAGRTVIVESDPTAGLAYRLDGSPLWDFEIAGFRRGDFKIANRSAGGLYMLEPYDPGAIPVVFVHGTASSPARWAEMVNELMSDPLAPHYQFWFFVYDTGNPIAYSAMRLREALSAAADEFDPSRSDPAFERMVLIGHSQGGLLVKMTTVDSGTRFWDANSKIPFDEVNLKPETRELLSRALFVKPLPFIDRVIFIATPQHGSFVAENWIGNLARRLVTFPATLLHTTTDILSLSSQGVFGPMTRMPTSVDNMRAGNPFLRTLSTLPIDDGVHVHSIIPVKGDGPFEEGDDGVVRYSSAHIDGVESELVVRSPHSVQGHPEAIEEVRRILRVHLQAGASSSNEAPPSPPGA